LAAVVAGACLLAALSPAPLAEAIQAPVLRVALTSPIGELNPLLASTDAAGQILKYQYETLVSLDEDNRIGEGVARSWNTADGKIWTFSLSDDRVFSDGTSLTSADVLYSFAALMTVHADGTATHPEVGNIAEVAAPDEYTVVIEVFRPQAFPPGTSVFILPQHIWSIASDPAAVSVPGDDGAATVGSGPFLLTAVTEAGVAMRANPLFWRGTPAAAGVLWQIYDDQLSAMNALVAGEVDVMADITPRDARTLETLDFVDVSAGVGESALILGINSGHTNLGGTFIGDGSPALRDPAMRRAITTAIDVDDIIEQAFIGMARPGVTLMPPAYSHYSGLASGTTAREHGVEAAAELLAAANYRLGADGKLIGPYGTALVLRLAFVATDASHQRTALLIRQTLAQLGIAVVLLPSNAELISANVLSGNHDLYLATHAAGPYPSVLLGANVCAARPPVAPPVPTDPNPDDASVDQSTDEQASPWAVISSGWCSPAFDELYAAQAFEPGPDRRAEFVKEAFSLLYDYDSLMVLAYPDALSAWWNQEFVSFGRTPATDGAVGSTLSYWTYYLAVPAKEGATGLGTVSTPERSWWRTGAIAAGIVAGIGLGMWANRRRKRHAQTRSARRIDWRGHDK
jgi:peptide/nickel transport system substrate-binding protein